KARGPGSRISPASVAGQSQLDEGRVRLAARPRGRPGRGPAVVAGAADVEMDPRACRELAEEQSALHEGALRRAAVAQLRLRGLHVVEVLVDEGHLPVPFGHAAAGPGDLLVPRLR